MYLRKFPVRDAVVTSSENFRGYDDSELLDPVSVNSADAVQAEILNEYQREFIAEGQLFFYHKRMKDERLNGYTVNYVFPKPDTETEFGK